MFPKVTDVDRKPQDVETDDPRGFRRVAVPKMAQWTGEVPDKAQSEEQRRTMAGPG